MILYIDRESESKFEEIFHNFQTGRVTYQFDDTWFNIKFDYLPLMNIDVKGTNPCIYVSEYISDRKCEKVKLKLIQLGIKYHVCDVYQKTYNNMYILV